MQESQQKSSQPQNINEYLEDSEKFLESMMDVTTPTKEEFEELLHKCTDTPTPPETTSPVPLLPRLLNFNESEVSPSLPRPPPSPPQRTRVPAADHLNSRLQLQQISPVAAHSSSGSQPKQISPVTAADPILGVKMMNVFVIPKGGTQKIPIKINVFNRVEKLRDELERFHKHVVPEKGRYFFIYQNKDYVMTETYAFNWYQMKDGDTIEITPESGPAKPNRKKWTIPLS